MLGGGTTVDVPERGRSSQKQGRYPLLTRRKEKDSSSSRSQQQQQRERQLRSRHTGQAEGQSALAERGLVFPPHAGNAQRAEVGKGDQQGEEEQEAEEGAEMQSGLKLRQQREQRRPERQQQSRPGLPRLQEGQEEHGAESTSARSTVPSRSGGPPGSRKGYSLPAYGLHKEVELEKKPKSLQKVHHWLSCILKELLNGRLEQRALQVVWHCAKCARQRLVGARHLSEGEVRRRGAGVGECGRIHQSCERVGKKEDSWRCKPCRERVCLARRTGTRPLQAKAREKARARQERSCGAQLAWRERLSEPEHRTRASRKPLCGEVCQLLGSSHGSFPRFWKQYKAKSSLGHDASIKDAGQLLPSVPSP